MRKPIKLFTILLMIFCSQITVAQEKTVNIVDWAVEATMATYSYNAKNINQRLPVMQEYFTSAAWTDFLNALTKSGNLEIVRTDNLAVSATTMGNPTMTKHRIANGADEWVVELPILVTYAHADVSKEIKYWVYLKIIKNPVPDTKQPYAIEQFVARPR